MAAPQFGQLRVSAFIELGGLFAAGRASLTSLRRLYGGNPWPATAFEMNQIGAEMNEFEA